MLLAKEFRPELRSISLLSQPKGGGQAAPLVVAVVDCYWFFAEVD